LRKANYDLEGPLVYKKRYKDFFDKKDRTHVGNEQLWDGMLIEQCMKIAFQDKGLYVSEYRDYIEDFEWPKNKSHTKFYMQQVFWDHVVFTPSGRVILLESDDPSHFNEEYCKLHNWDFDNIKARDRIKNIWAQKLGYDLIRLPHYLSDQQKKELILNVFKND
jgi:hypothetical protein